MIIWEVTTSPNEQLEFPWQNVNEGWVGHWVPLLPEILCQKKMT